MQGRYDVVFMDIELPGMSGMECAAKLREFDTMVILIFVTRLAQYAEQGYNVSALDYIVKPVTYVNFAAKLDRALTAVDLNERKYIIVRGDEFYRIDVNEIVFVEIQAHRLNYHLITGKTVTGWGTLKKLAQELRDFGFSCCSSSYLINFRYVLSIQASKVKMTDGRVFNITRRSKDKFLSDLGWFAGNGGSRW